LELLKEEFSKLKSKKKKDNENDLQNIDDSSDISEDEYLNNFYDFK